jgi:hypothetical protein
MNNKLNLKKYKLAAIFDMDGTLVDTSKISYMIRGKKLGPSPELDAYHAEAAKCPPNDWVVRLAKDLSEAGLDIFIVSARHEKHRNLTIQWLNKYNIPFKDIYLREDGDSRPDVETKRDSLDKIKSNGDVIILAVEDNPSVIKLWQDNGIPTIVVPGYIA